jgi:hypothetical protein
LQQFGDYRISALLKNELRLSCVPVNSIEKVLHLFFLICTLCHPFLSRKKTTLMQYSYKIENETDLEFEYEGELVKITFNKERYRIHIICNHPLFIDAFKSPWIVVHSIDSFISAILKEDKDNFFFMKMEHSLREYLDKLNPSTADEIVLPEALINNLTTSL